MEHTFGTEPAMAGERLDVIVIGAGVTGCAIARVLSRYRLRVCVVDAAEDVAMGASRANSAIVHAGYDCTPGSMMARMNTEGNAMMQSWCEELEVPLMRTGSLVIAFDKNDEKELTALYERGKQNGVPDMRIISGDEARAIEPTISGLVIRALYAPTAGINCPYELTIACAENARENGVRFLLGARVTAIAREADALVVQAGTHTLRTAYVVNAAGAYADDVARMLGDDSFVIRPRKGEYLLMDQSAADVHTVIFQTPSAMGKGVLVSPTVDGNVFAGPDAQDTKDKTDNSNTASAFEELKRLSLNSVPTLNLRAVITAFAGVRALPSTDDFILRASDMEPRLIHAAGICSPGLTSAPAIAQYIASLLLDQGLTMEEKPNYQPRRKHIRRLRAADDGGKLRLIAEDARYAQIICRCETVSEAEIIQAIARGATSLDGVKRRTRAGMGRCQGGFCGPRVMQILSRELGVPMERLTKFGGGSNLLAGKLKETAFAAEDAAMTEVDAQ